MHHNNVTLGMLLSELVPLCRDVCHVIIRFVCAIDTALLTDVLECEIPLDIVVFRLFRRHRPTNQAMFVCEDAVNDAKRRRRIHEYCEAHGFFARTKYRLQSTDLTIRCDACGTF